MDCGVGVGVVIEFDELGGEARGREGTSEEGAVQGHDAQARGHHCCMMRFSVEWNNEGFDD